MIYYPKNIVDIVDKWYCEVDDLIEEDSIILLKKMIDNNINLNSEGGIKSA